MALIHGMGSWAIECTDLKKTYRAKPPVDALRGVDLTVAEGECFGVLGPNGAGKTTAIEILEGLLDATSGEVRVLDKTWQHDANQIREEIGISLQETRFSDKLSVFETVSLFRSFYSSGISPDDALGKVSLKEKGTSWVKNLCGGQRQRLAIATAIVGNPKLLFLDEPTTGLDPRSRRQLWEVIDEFSTQGRTVLLTTHYMEEAERLCDRVAIIDRGKIIALGTPTELIAGLGGEHMIEFSLHQEVKSLQQEDAWTGLPEVSRSLYEQGLHRLTVQQPHIVIPEIFKHVAEQSLQMASLTTRHASLEDVFVKLTGRHLDADEGNGE